MRGIFAVVLLAACARAPESQPTTATVTATASATVTASATATVTASATGPKTGCATKAYSAPAGAKPSLSVVARGAVLDVTWENVGTAPVCIYPWVATHEEQFDWVSVELTGVGAPRTLVFTDDRDKSAPVSIGLSPGEKLTKTIDLAGWAARRPNGTNPLVPGTYSASVTYDSTRETWVWAGSLHATTTVVVR